MTMFFGRKDQWPAITADPRELAIDLTKLPSSPSLWRYRKLPLVSETIEGPSVYRRYETDTTALRNDVAVLPDADWAKKTFRSMQAAMSRPPAGSYFPSPQMFYFYDGSRWPEPDQRWNSHGYVGGEPPVWQSDGLPRVNLNLERDPIGMPAFFFLGRFANVVVHVSGVGFVSGEDLTHGLHFIFHAWAVKSVLYEQLRAVAAQSGRSVPELTT